ncbi:MAG TPA: heme exporter protein CcmD [Beijerinckiaceae bacterium]|nr:heme exporter protein CcmD [Beijerinckiaceae bacterium]
MPYPHIVYISAAYVVTALIVAAMIAAILIDHRALRRELSRLGQIGETQEGPGTSRT